MILVLRLNIPQITTTPLSEAVYFDQFGFLVIISYILFSKLITDALFPIVTKPPKYFYCLCQFVDSSYDSFEFNSLINKWPCYKYNYFSVHQTVAVSHIVNIQPATQRRTFYTF